MFKQKQRYNAFIQKECKQKEKERDHNNILKNVILQNEHHKMLYNSEKNRIKDICEQHAVDRIMLEEIKKEELQRRSKDLVNHDNSLVYSLKRDKLEAIREEKMRQQIRENSYELRELKKQLDAALIQKQQIAQMVEKRALAFDATLHEVEYAKKVLAAQEESENLRLQFEDLKFARKIRVKKDMEDQLRLKVEKKENELELKLLEKLQVDEIVRKIYEEDLDKRKREEKDKELLKREMNKAVIEREEAKRLAEEQVKLENEKISRFLADKEAKEKERLLQKKEVQKAFDEFQIKVGVKILEEEKTRKEREELYQVVALAEEDIKARKHAENEEEKRFKLREILIAARDEAMHFKSEKIQTEKNLELEEKARINRAFEESEQRALQNEQQRRDKKLQLRNETLKLIEMRKEKVLRQVELNRAANAEALAREERLRQLIEEEKARMISEHKMLHIK